MIIEQERRPFTQAAETEFSSASAGSLSVRNIEPIKEFKIN